MNQLDWETITVGQELPPLVKPAITKTQTPDVCRRVG